jgi:hypothetical protein
MDILLLNAVSKGTQHDMKAVRIMTTLTSRLFLKPTISNIDKYTGKPEKYNGQN